jgi:DNA-binding XRE family transcriptional regulator
VPVVWQLATTKATSASLVSAAPSGRDTLIASLEVQERGRHERLSSVRQRERPELRFIPGPPYVTRSSPIGSLAAGDDSISSHLWVGASASAGVVTLAQRLADRLRKLRDEAGLSQVQMAKRLGVSRSTFKLLEAAGQNATLRILDRLCRALRRKLSGLYVGRRMSPTSSRTVATDKGPTAYRVDSEGPHG